MPLFALANSGISFKNMTFIDLYNPLTLGIIAGLFLGKQIGVLLFTWVTIKLQWATLPKDSTWWNLYGVALLCGIGFTMSLFLGILTFEGQDNYLVSLRLGVILASLLSGICGALVFLMKPNSS